MPLPAFVSRTTHHEAIDWATRASANGGVISTNTLRAVSDFCRAISAAGIRGSISRLNPFSGGNLLGSLVPLYRSTSFGGTVLGNATDTNANFVSGDYSNSGGLKGNGTSKYLDTGFASSLFASTSSVHLSLSGTGLETTSGGTFYSAICSYDGTIAALYDMGVSYSSPTNNRLSRLSISPGSLNVSSSSRGSSEAHLLATRTATNASALYGGGTLLASETATVSPASSARTFFVFAFNNSGAATFYTSATLRMYSIGSAMTAQNAADFSAAVVALNAALGR